MSYLKKLVKPLLYMLIILLVGSLFITLINYVNSGFLFKILKLLDIY